MHSQNWRYGVIKLVKKRLFDNNIHLYLLPQSKNKNQKNAQTPTGIMISTKKQFHLLGENQRQSSPSLTNQTLCIHEHFKLQT